MIGQARTIDLREHLPPNARQPDAATVSQAFDAALEVLAARGGGSLYVPPGTWRIERTVIVGTAGVRLYGAGIRATRLHLAAGARCAILRTHAPGVCVERMTLIGNLPHLTEGNLPNGVSLRGDVNFVELRDIVIERAARKALSIKGRRETAGAFALNSVRNVVLHRCGDDGIDFKLEERRTAGDDGPPPDGCPGPRAFLRNLSIRGFSARFPRGDLHGERGIDVRGRVHMHNIEVLDVVHGNERASGAKGIVFRAGKPSLSHGAGGAWSVLENYFVTCQPPALPGGGFFTLQAAAPTRSSRGIAVPAEIERRLFVTNGNVIASSPAPARAAKRVGPEKRRAAIATVAPAPAAIDRLPTVAAGRMPRWAAKIAVAMPMPLRAAWAALTMRRASGRPRHNPGPTRLPVATVTPTDSGLHTG